MEIWYKKNYGITCWIINLLNLLFLWKHGVSFRCTSLVSLIIFLTFRECSSQSAKSYLMNFESNNELADSFGSGLKDKMQALSGCEALKSLYERRFGAKEFSVHKRNGTKTVLHFASELEKMLNKKHSALKRLVEAGEQFAASTNWSWTPSPNYNNVQYINAREEDNLLDHDDYADLRKTMVFEKNSRFKTKVNINTSVVQVPFNVYCKDSDLLKSVEWSKNLNAQFRENLQRDPSLKWQYFGSVEGYVRIFPGFQWKLVSDTGKLNLYDCRTQQWYTQAATYPKDMVVLVDSSGSMTGLRKSIAVHAVTTLLGTLSDNDFFNVLTFKKTTEVVEPCFNGTLVRADKKNIETVLRSLQNITTSDIACFETAFRTALELMTNFHKNGSAGSGCNCAIMLITDGAPENYQWIFDEAKATRNMSIRVFAYLVGQEKNYLKPVREIACNNRGFFTQVESPNSVTEQVLRHVKVINRPLAFVGDHHTAWTKGYRDRSNENEGLGLITTVAMPVYRNTTYAPPSLLGVMAIDVLVSDMIDTMPVNTVGVNGYIFIITNNGYTMFHPRLNDKYNAKENPSNNPDSSSFDIDSLEYGSSHELVRSGMVQLKSSSVSDPEIVTPLDNWSRVIISSGVYYFTPIPGTPFRLALVLPSGYGETKVTYTSDLRIKQHGASYDEKHCDMIQQQLAEYDAVRIDRLAATCSLMFSDVQLAAEWRYCHFRNQEMIDSVGEMSQLQMMKAYLLDESNTTIKCNEELLNGVLFDVFLSAALVPVWSERRDFNNSSRAGIEMSFFVSKSGLVRQYWYENVSEEYERGRASLFRFTRTEFPSIYRRTVNYPTGTWMYTLPENDAEIEKFGRNVVIATTPMTHRTAVLGVCGLLLNQTQFQSMFWKETALLGNTNCAEDVDTGFDCFLIDENGIVMLSRQQEHLGKFFGALNGHVMRDLIDAGVFRKLDLFEHGAMCFRPESNAKSGTSNIGAKHFDRVWINMVWLVQQLFRSIVNITIYSWWSMIWSVQATPASASASLGDDTVSSCLKKYEVFVVNRTKMPHSGQTLCRNNYIPVECERQYGVFSVSSSNLFLVVVGNVETSEVNCKCQNKSDPITPIRNEEIIYPEEKKCQKLREHKERRRPDGCIAHHKAETSMNLPCYIKTNSASRIFPLWWKTKHKAGAGSTIVYRAWLSCLTIHLTFVALCAVVMDGSLLRFPYDW
uniref:Voltage-dependent calcium channel subunit alpha-2/delta-3-like n=1 Tax=Phallusia mammillata TaxID=59560 RepID=A0A6F9D813_9ASCI|nr:voltage-dependent calcium channel subunit alpha-2/delta-3-like [Phallusia mammillata]